MLIQYVVIMLLLPATAALAVWCFGLQRENTSLRAETARVATFAKALEFEVGQLRIIASMGLTKDNRQRKILSDQLLEYQRKYKP